jgi:hypothetical protein
MVEPLRHRQTKGAATDMPSLPPPRHIPTLPITDAQRHPRTRLRRPAFGKSAVLKRPGIRGGGDVPIECCRRDAEVSSVSFGGRPPVRPTRRAAERPAWVRSRNQAALELRPTRQTCPAVRLSQCTASRSQCVRNAIAVAIASPQNDIERAATNACRTSAMHIRHVVVERW